MPNPHPNQRTHQVGAKNYAADANVQAACLFVVPGCMSADAG